MFGRVLYVIGRAIARWNRHGIKMIISLTFFGSREPRARSVRKCDFYDIHAFFPVWIYFIFRLDCGIENKQLHKCIIGISI